MEFSEWIVEELEKRGWSRSEAARRGGISPSMFDKVINGYSRPGVKFIEGIAKAFKMSSAEVVMRMHQQKGNDPWADEMSHKLSQLSPGLRGVSEITLLTAAGNYTFQFRGSDKAHMAYRYIMKQILTQAHPQLPG